ncbi:MAG: cytosine permease [Firmicutes bacterium]|nr:cytosine permease [Bacillota bacterium]
MNNTEQEIVRETQLGTMPVMTNERMYGFLDAVLILSGYCIATWSYTQGAYLTTLVGFKQLLIGAFFGAILMLAIYQLPVILSVRYGIDIWVWLRAALGYKGVVAVSIAVILVNYPWYAVSADMFASSMNTLAGVLHLPQMPVRALSLFCVIFGSWVAYKGLKAITQATRILVPLLLLVGVFVFIAGFMSVPADVIVNYRPAEGTDITKYIISIEANFAFVITLVGGMAEIPRLSKTEKGGFWAGVLGQGLAGSFFVVLGAVMAIATQYTTGVAESDPTVMLATLSAPVLALCSLLLVAFANIGTQAVGAYLYAVMLKSSFKRISYRKLVVILAVYVGILCIWGRITEYFGSFLTIGACVYAPLAAVLFTDFFFIRKQKISLKDAYMLDGHNAYEYTKGFNLKGIACIIFGCIISLVIYDPINSIVHIPALFYFTPTGFSFLSTCVLYYVLNKVGKKR